MHKRLATLPLEDQTIGNNTTADSATATLRTDETRHFETKIYTF